MSLSDWAWSMIRNHERNIAYYNQVLTTMKGRRRGGYVSQLNQNKRGLIYWQKELKRIERNIRTAAMSEGGNKHESNRCSTLGVSRNNALRH